MKEDVRPAWPFKMLEADFRRIEGLGMIVSVAAKWEYTSADSSREWLEVSAAHDRRAIMPDGWKDAWQFVGYSSVPGLFKLTYEGERMRKQMDEIDRWEAKNIRDRAEFERLKKKFVARPTKGANRE